MLISMLLLFSTSKFHFQAKKTSMYSITKFQVRFRFIINMLFILHSNANLLTSMNQYAPQWTYSKCTNAWVLIRRIFSAYLFDLGAIPQPITRAILLLLLLGVGRFMSGYPSFTKSDSYPSRHRRSRFYFSLAGWDIPIKLLSYHGQTYWKFPLSCMLQNLEADLSLK